MRGRKQNYSMKNEVEIANEIKSLEKDYSGQFVDKREKKRAQKRATFLKNALLIIAKFPNKETVLKQLDKATETLRMYNAAYKSTPEWCCTADLVKKYRSEIKSKYEPTKLKSQVEIIKFVLEQ